MAPMRSLQNACLPSLNSFVAEKDRSDLSNQVGEILPALDFREVIALHHMLLVSMTSGDPLRDCLCLIRFHL